MNKELYYKLLDSFRRWKASRKSIGRNDFLGYGSFNEYKEHIKNGFYCRSNTISINNTKEWFYITEKGIRVLKDWESLGLTLADFDSYTPNIEPELRTKLLNAMNDNMCKIA